MDNQMNQYDNGGGYNNGQGGRGQNGNGGENGNQPPRRPSAMMIVMAVLSTILFCFILWNFVFGGSGNTQEVSYTEFLEYINTDRVESVELHSGSERVLFQLKASEEGGTNTASPIANSPFYAIANPQITYSTLMMESMSILTARLEEHGIEGTRVASDSSGMIMNILIYVILPVVLMWILLGVVFKRMGGAGGPMGVGKSNAKV